MANHVTYAMSDGSVIALRIPISRGVMLEDWLGVSIQEAVKNNLLDRIATNLDIIAAGTDEDREHGRKTASDIYADMLDNGKTFKEFQFLTLDLLVSAGFLAAAGVEAVKLAAEAQEKMIAEKAQRVKTDLANISETMI